MYVYKGAQLSLEHYHGVPVGWHVAEIRRAHSKLGGTFRLDGPDATEPGAPSFLIHRYDWLQYRETLYRVADGVRAGDAACVEIAVRFIVLHHIGSYSGYVRTRLARALKRAELSESQKRRLHDHFQRLFCDQERVVEFSDYVRLWLRFLTPERRAAVVSHVRSQQDGDAKAAWLSSRFNG